MPQQIPDNLLDVSDTISAPTRIRTNYVGFASFAILVWDHIDTFSDEVELVWKGRKGLFVYLFLFNRYFTPLGFIINLYAYLSPSWTNEVRTGRYIIHRGHLTITYLQRPTTSCAHFVRYEGSTFTIAIVVVGLMMLLRVNALYPGQKWITGGLAFLLLFDTGVYVWLISRGEPVIHSPDSGMHACTMIFDPSINGAITSSSAWIPLFYDTIIFALTLYRTVPPIRRAEASYIIKRLLEDGLLYYSVIFSVTCVLTFMIVAVPPGTKNIAAQTEQLITVAMMSRITLNLKKAGLHDDALSSPKSLFFDRNKRRQGSSASSHPPFILRLPPLTTVSAPSPTHSHDHQAA
ncbi:hypothetical protein M413DRAFT_31621 [Hebeloma cylindrosporum]|uniref:DUF6533 domain-containing protein n=1 Tax=Hebeloma cylindrosporum TaxID=76867 RepID=A0A0C3BIQ5_HEBCY|nr:hypothetical protein M413DRAFT_31621 [Hebeloma cylindrosporum h7]